MGGHVAGRPDKSALGQPDPSLNCLIPSHGQASPQEVRQGRLHRGLETTQSDQCFMVLVDFVHETGISSQVYYTEPERTPSPGPDGESLDFGPRSPAGSHPQSPLEPCTSDAGDQGLKATPQPPVSVDRCWVLRDSTDALLLQHFTNHLSWFV